MSDIIQRTFASGADKGITLDNREYARKMLIGTSWNRVRVGALVAMTPNGTSNISSIKFTIGACSGIANPYSAASTTNFIGAIFGTANAATGGLWVYKDGSGNPFYRGEDGAGRSLKRVGSTTSPNAGLFSTSPVCIPTTNGAVQRRLAVMVDITKGSPNYTVQAYIPLDVATITVEKTVAEFVSEMSTIGDIAGYYSAGQGNTQTLAFDEGAGGLDTACIYYSIASYPLEVYDLRVYRFS